VATVLIVEDDVPLRHMFRIALMLDRYTVVEAGDGLHGLRVLDAIRVDLVVLDLGLPVVSGHVILHDLAARAPTQSVPVVIVVTGQPGSYAGLLHARRVLHKPVSADELLGTVRHCLAEGSRASGT